MQKLLKGLHKLCLRVLVSDNSTFVGSVCTEDPVVSVTHSNAASNMSATCSWVAPSTLCPLTARMWSPRFSRPSTAAELPSNTVLMTIGKSPLLLPWPPTIANPNPFGPRRRVIFLTDSLQNESSVQMIISKKLQIQTVKTHPATTSKQHSYDIMFMATETSSYTVPAVAQNKLRPVPPSAASLMPVCLLSK